MNARAGTPIGTIALITVAAITVALNIGAEALNGADNFDATLGGYVIDGGVGIVYAVCAVVARRFPIGRGPSWLLVAGGILWTLGSFTGAIWQLSSWWVPLIFFQTGLSAIIVALVVGYPSGRISGRLSWAALIAAIALVVVDGFAHVLFFDPVTLGWCDCVPNPVALVSDRSISQELQVFPAQWGIITTLGLASVAVIRWLRGTAPWRALNLLMLITVLVLTICQMITNLSALGGTPAAGIGPIYLADLATAAIPVIYVVGLGTLSRTRSRIADVILAARDGLDRPSWDRLVREALDDRTAAVLWPGSEPGSFVDASGAAAEAVPNGSLPVVSGTQTIAVLVHDPATAAKGDLLSSLAESLRLMVENDRLSSELEQSLVQVRESRQRLVGAADDARRRIERDLHDGAQQLLLTAALSLERAGRRAAASDDGDLTGMLASASEQLMLARRELRELARGITPVTLSHGGLDAALEELALRCPVPTSVTVSGDGRPSELAETTVYFTVAECLTNLAKHAGATTASVDVVLGDPLRMTVTDDGLGGAVVSPGGGLAGLVDRIEAIGGEFTVWSPVGRGTVIRATIPALEREPA